MHKILLGKTTTKQFKHNSVIVKNNRILIIFYAANDTVTTIDY